MKIKKTWHFRGSAFLVLIFLIGFVSEPLAQASKPSRQRSAEACAALLAEGPDETSPSARSLIPLGLLFASMKSEIIPVLWRTGDTYAKQLPTPGLVHMFHTAELAADHLIEGMKIKAVTPSYHSLNPWEGAARTLELIESSNPPEYIRKAVLIRENVVMVVPILKRVVRRNPRTGKAMYVPIVTKGHQDLRLEDKLSAAFAAWALEEWQGEFTKAMIDENLDTAQVFLRPMAEKRNLGEKASGRFNLRPSDYRSQVLDIYEHFMSIAEAASKLDPSEAQDISPKRRWADCAKSQWGSYCRKKLADAEHISMMPNPPTELEGDSLAGLGLSKMSSLSKIDINTDEFISLSLKSNIAPDKLRYYIAHARAATKDSPLIIEPFEDPFSETDTIVHIDFEDLLTPDLRSGVFLFGIKIESANGRRPAEKIFIFSEALTQEAIDDAWAKFLRVFKKHDRIKGNRYKTTTYSKHEQVKFEQQFDVLRGPPESFSPATRRSAFYSEFVRETKSGKKHVIGRLIRNKDFFSKYPDIKPKDVFTVLDTTIDLLDYMRNNFAMPTYSNSIKQVVPYAGGKIRYDSGSNGLEAMAWAKDAYATGNKALFDKMERYNSYDIDGNSEITSYIRKYAGHEVDESLRWRPAFTDGIGEEGPSILKMLENATDSKRLVASLEERANLLETILGKSVAELDQKQVKELKEYLDRSAYLADLKELEDKNYSEDELNAIRQYQKFKMENTRQALLRALFSKVNPQADAEQVNRVTQAVSHLFSKPSNYLTPQHIEQMIVLEQMKQVMAKARIKPVRTLNEKNILRALELPERVQSAYERFATDQEVSAKTLRDLWYGLYYFYAFPNGGESK